MSTYKTLSRSIEAKTGLSVFLTALIYIIIYGLLVGYPLMLLWNWLMVGIFELPAIDFWQALGLWLLSNILFKNAPSTRE